jgi:hypothetical protein
MPLSLLLFLMLSGIAGGKLISLPKEYEQEYE